MSTNYLVSKFEDYLNEYHEIGTVMVVNHPIALVKGLPNARTGEVVVFANGDLGLVTSLSYDYCEILTFTPQPVQAGIDVTRTNELLSVPVGNELLGNSINPLGKSLYDTKISPHYDAIRPVDVPAKGLEYREKVTAPFITGVTVVDLMIPLGKGQRELILGDRKTGKTEFIMQSILTQAKKGTICVYSGIGRKKTDIKKVEDFVHKHKIDDKVCIISTSSSDSLGLIYITPYAAMTVAEYFRDNGNDVLIIMDDLTTHAKFYREISLLGKKFPGRSSYPGDIFYTHAKLLERAGNFKIGDAVNSITCLPIAETLEGDISGYVQTNLMSITDGHIFFDPDLFDEGRRPAVNYFLSVTRVGRQTQSKLRWGINRELNSFLTLFEKTQRFVHFGAELNDGIKATLNMGERVLSFFDQPMGQILDLNVQIVVFCLIWAGFFNDKSNSQIKLITQNAIHSYDNDEDFKKNVDELIQSARDFNELLGKTAAKSRYYLDYFSKKNNEVSNSPSVVAQKESV